MRVHFFNDTIFLFTIIQSYDPVENGKINEENKDLRFNGHSFFGIARLVKYKGIKTWIGVSDCLNAFIGPKDISYLSLKDRDDFSVILKLLENKDKFAFGNSQLQYQVYQFFLQKNKINMKGIDGVNRFFEIGNYYKVDTSKMLFGIAADDGFFKMFHKSYTGSIQDNLGDIAFVQRSCSLQSVPINEMVPDNKLLASLNKGDKVCMTAYNFMKYTFVIQFDKDEKIISYGWIPRNYLSKIK